MKNIMSTFVFILLVVGVAYLAIFHKPSHHSEAELKKWFSAKLMEITAGLESDIEKDEAGEYPHAGKQSFAKRGSITYILRDKNNTRFDISDRNSLRSQDIMQTVGYKALEQKADTLNLVIRLDENAVEGDGVNSFNELDEYTDDFPRYYTVTISGW
jgi:hypothetical protein